MLPTLSCHVIGMTEEGIVPEDKILCACGCGEITLRFDSRGRERRFKQWHRKTLYTEEERITRKKEGDRRYRDGFQQESGIRLCECGCGQEIPQINRKHQHARFKHGHNAVVLCGDKSANWKGGITTRRGYRYIYKPDHHRAGKSGYIHEAVLVLEQKLGRPLQVFEEPHHVNKIHSDNRPENIELVTHENHTRIHRTLDMSDRVCVDCDSRNTSMRKPHKSTHSSRPRWYNRGLPKGHFRCNNCYYKYRHKLLRAIN